MATAAVRHRWPSRRLRSIPGVIAIAALLAAGCSRSPDARPTADRAPGPYTVALVYCGWEVWIGNDQNPQLAASDPSRWPGALLSIQAALDRADLAHTAPPGSRGVAISYDDRVMLRVPMGPIANLTSAALGHQADYSGTLGTELVQGLVRAVDELEKAPAGKKVLLVVSDGTDTDNERAVKRLPGLKQRIARLGIRVTSIVYKASLSRDGDLLTSLTGESTRAMSRDDITLDLVSALQHLQDPGT